MNHFYLLLSVCALLVATACSTSRQSQSTIPETDSPYPGWYDSSGEMMADSTGFYGYADALADDSLAAVAKAVEQAKANMEADISVKLEQARKAALSRSGAPAGLENPSFVLALRNAESDVTGLAERVNAVALPVEGRTGFRGYAQVQISQNQLFTLLDRSLSGNTTAWDAMKKTGIF